MKIPPELIFIVFLSGLVIGSFLNMLIYRLPREKNIVTPRSACTSCNKLIVWYENIPLLSYIFLRGRCSGCKSKISIRYPATELIIGLLAIILIPRVFSAQSLLYYIFHLSILSVFWVMLLVDIEHKILPDMLNAYLGVIFLLYSVLHYGWSHWVLGGAVGFLVPFGVTWSFYKLRGKIGLGGGDIKLYAVLGIFLGPYGAIQNIFFSCFFGSVIGIVLIIMKRMDRDHAMPFGPFIIIAAIIQIYFPFIPQMIF